MMRNANQWSGVLAPESPVFGFMSKPESAETPVAVSMDQYQRR